MSETASDRRLLEESMRWKQRYQQAKAQLEALQAEHIELQNTAEELASGYQALESEFSEFQAQAQASPSELEQQLQALKGEIRQRDHRAAFERAAQGKIRPDALEAAWKLSGYDPDSDTPDEGQISGLVEQLAKANPFLAQTPDEGPGDTAAKAATVRVVPQQGPRGGQGAPAAASPTPVVTRDQLRDPAWTVQNAAVLASGNFTVQD